MKGKKIKLSAVFLLGFGLTGLHAQEAIPATGGEASGTGGSASYSVGQVFYTTNTGTSGSVAQGVQQPYEISIITGVEQAKGINLVCSAYPNPATDLLTLEIEASMELNTQSMQYLCYDINGKILKSNKISGRITNIDMRDLVPATYFLKLTQNKKEIITFKIIKNQ